MFCSILFFAEGDLCGTDFENASQQIYLNIGNIISISSLIKFRLPFSGTERGSYGVITMINGDRFCMKEKDYVKFITSNAVNISR